MNKETLLERRPRQKRVLEMCDDKENPSKRISLQLELKSIGVQCSKLDEDFMTRSEDGNYYWKIMAFKRRAALNEIIKENRQLNIDIDQLNLDNELLRDENKSLLEILEEANTIKELIKDSRDSGFFLENDNI
jgi:arginyl-tRNA synthetase